MNKGFTLIELLVVVLIIGILASIALPQYTKAVERSRMAEAVQILGDLATAQSVFYMQHNEFAADLDDLNERGDVNIPGPSGANWELEVAADGVQTMTREGGMYDGAGLRLTVNDDGSILKECLPNGHDDFCTMAQTAGYRAAAALPDLGRIHTQECRPGKCGWGLDIPISAREVQDEVKAEDVAKWLKYVETAEFSAAELAVKKV